MFQTFSNSLHVWENLCSIPLIMIYEGADFFILCRSLPICSWFSAIVITWWKQLPVSFFWFNGSFCLFKPFRRFYIRSTLISGCIMAYIIDSWNITKNKVANLHGFFHSYLILLHKWTTGFVCITAYHNFAAITFRIHCSFFIIACWWHKFRFHCYLSDLIFSRYSFNDDFSPFLLLYSTHLPSKAYLIFLVYQGIF